MHLLSILVSIILIYFMGQTVFLNSISIENCIYTYFPVPVHFYVQVVILAILRSSGYTLSPKFS